MPHLIIEYAQELADAERASAMLDAVHQAALGTGLFHEHHIRTRAIPVVHYRTGAGRTPFVHAQLRIHSGRSPDQKRALSAAVLAAIRGCDWRAGSITVEVVDMDVQTYAKHVS